MATAVTSSHDEYDPDDDPLFGRLVSIDLHDGDEPGHSWRDGLVAHVDTEIVDGIERATGVYNVVWGRFDRADDVMRVPADKREWSGRIDMVRMQTQGKLRVLDTIKQIGRAHV